MHVLCRPGGNRTVFDKRLFLSRMVTILILAVSLAALHLILLDIVEPVAGTVAAVVVSFSSIGLILFGTPLRRTLQDAVDGRFLKGRYAYQQKLADAVYEIITILDLDELLNYIIEALKVNLGLAKACLFLKADQGGYRVVRSFGISRQQGMTMVWQETDLGWLGQGPFLRSQKRGTRLAPEADRLAKAMADIQAEILFPLVFKGNLLGVLALGSNGMGGSYVLSDLQLLESFAREAAVAIENARLYGEAITDRLTRLCHRRYFMMRIKEAIEGVKRYRYPVALLVADIDHFVTINNKYGHIVGDMILKEVAGELRAGCRETDIVARYESDAFAILLPETTGEDAALVAERLRARIARLKPEGIDVAISVGVAHVGPDEAEISGDVLVSRAQASLAAAKGGGGDRVGSTGDRPS